MSPAHLLARARAALAPQVAEMRRELAGNLRLRIGLAAIAAIVAAYGLLSWQEYIQARQKEVTRIRRDVARLEALSGSGPQWVARRQEAGRARTAYEARLWRAPSVAQAQASFQDWVAARLKALNVIGPKLNIVDDRDAAANASGADHPCPVRLRVEFPFSARQLEDFLGAIYMSGRNVRVESIFAGQSKRKLEMTLLTWTTIGETVEPDTPSASVDQSAPQAAGALDALIRKSLPQ